MPSWIVGDLDTQEDSEKTKNKNQFLQDKSAKIMMIKIMMGFPLFRKDWLWVNYTDSYWTCTPVWWVFHDMKAIIFCWEHGYQ